MPRYKKYKIPILDKTCKETNNVKTLLETGFFTDKLTAGKVSFFVKVFIIFIFYIIKIYQNHFLPQNFDSGNCFYFPLKGKCLNY